MPLKLRRAAGHLVIALLIVSASRAGAQQTRQLSTTGLAGQRVAVLPLTLVAADPALLADSLYAPYRDRRPTLQWADSLIGETLVGSAPEVNWVLPPELRKMARRSPGTVADPDQMGQAILRSTRIKEVPDPLRASLRSLVAIAGGRYALVPASLTFGRDEDGRIHADLSLAITDGRNGAVLWRSLAVGRAATPAEALGAALATVVPPPTP